MDARRKVVARIRVARVRAEMGRMIEAGAESARAMEAWADAARQASADGSVTAGETATVEAAERDMADAEAAAYDAFMSTPAGQIMGGIAPHAPDFTEAYLQASVLSGEETACY